MSRCPPLCPSPVPRNITFVFLSGLVFSQDSIQFFSALDFATHSTHQSVTSLSTLNLLHILELARRCTSPSPPPPRASRCSPLSFSMPFGWGGSSSPSGPTRDAHIQGFLSHQTFSRGTKNCPTDRGCNLFETSFAPSANASPYTLQVYLSAAFPKQPPVITLLRPNLATHPILNENMQCVKLNSLSGWGGGQAGGESSTMSCPYLNSAQSSPIQPNPTLAVL